MGKKYIIELEDNKLAYTAIIIDGVPYIKSLQLLPYTEPDLEQVKKEAYEAGMNSNAVRIADDRAHEAYQRGLNDAWEAARKIQKMTYGEIKECFGVEPVYKPWVCCQFIASEAIEKIRAYEEKKKAEQEQEIKVGDEVMLQADHEEKGICISKEGGKMYVMWPDGSAGKWGERDLIKTGRHFPEIVEILKKMGADE